VAWRESNQIISTGEQGRGWQVMTKRMVSDNEAMSASTLYAITAWWFYRLSALLSSLAYVS